MRVCVCVWKKEMTVLFILRRERMVSLMSVFMHMTHSQAHQRSFSRQSIISHAAVTRGTTAGWIRCISTAPGCFSARLSKKQGTFPAHFFLFPSDYLSLFSLSTIYTRTQGAFPTPTFIFPRLCRWHISLPKISPTARPVGSFQVNFAPSHATGSFPQLPRSPQRSFQYHLRIFPFSSFLFFFFYDFQKLVIFRANNFAIYFSDISENRKWTRKFIFISLRGNTHISISLCVKTIKKRKALFGKKN